MSALAHRCEIVTDEAGFAGLERDWNALHDLVADAYLSDGFDWARVSWEMVGRPRGRELFCLVVRRGPQVVAIWPLVVSRRGVCRVAGPLTSETTEYCPFLVDPAADLQAVWRAIRAGLSRRVDLLSLASVREERPLGLCLADDRRAVRVLSLPSSQLSGAGAADWSDYLAGRSRGLPSALRRDRRRLRSLGETRFEEATRPDRRQAIWSWMLANKRAGLARGGLESDWFGSQDYAEFVSATLQRFAAGGGRRIFTLNLDGAAIAAALCSVDRARVEAFVTTYDQAYAAFSPGKLLLEEIARWAFERGLILDLRMGGEPYKTRWADQFGAVSFYVLPVTWAGALLARLDGARRWARRRVPRRLRAAALGRLK